MDFEAKMASRLEEQEAKDAKIDDLESVHRILRLQLAQHANQGEEMSTLQDDLADQE